jgi:hypothetical protein
MAPRLASLDKGLITPIWQEAMKDGTIATIFGLRTANLAPCFLLRDANLIPCS